jgi:hypothetical protein
MAPYAKGIDQCGWVFDFCNTHQFQALENSETKNCQFWVFKSFQNQRIAGFGYLKKKNQIKKPAGSGYFKNFKGAPGFMKEPAKTW